MDVNLGVLQLSEEQAKVYQKLLVSGQLSRAEISISTSLNASATQTILDELVGKKLAREVPGMASRYAALLPLGSTKDELEAASSKMAVLGREIEETASSELSQLRDQLKAAADDFSQKSQQEIQALENSITQVKSSIAQSKENTNSSISDATSTQSSAIDTVASEQQTAIGAKVSQFKSDGSSRITSKQEGLVKSSQEAKQKDLSIRTAATEGLTDLDLSPLTSIEQDSSVTLNNVLTDAGAKINGYSQKALEVAAQSEQLFTESATTLEAAGGEFVRSIKTELQTSGSQLDEAIRQRVLKFDDFQTSLQKGAEDQKSILDQVTANNAKLVETSSNALQASQTNFQEKTNQIDASTISALDQVNQGVTQKLEESEGVIASHLQQAHSEMHQLLSNEVEAIQSSLQQQFNQFLEQTSQELASQVSSFSESMSAKLAEQNSQRSELTKATINDISNQVNSTKTNVSSSISGANSEYQEQVGQLDQQLNVTKQEVDTQIASNRSSLDNLITETEDLVTSSKSRLNDWNQNVQDQIRQHLGSIDAKVAETLQSKITEMKSQMETSVTALKTESDASFSEIQDQFTQLTQDTTAKVEQAMQQMSSSLSAIHQNLMDRLKTSLEQAGNSYYDLIDQQTASGQELITQLDQDVAVIEQDISATMAEGISSVKDGMVQLLNSVQQSLSSTANSLFGEVSAQIDKVQQVGSSILQQVETLSSQGTDAQMQVVEKTFANYGQKYKSSTEEVSDKVTALASILDSFFKLQEQTETATIKTTHVVGKQAIIQYMTDMISRVKSKMTVLAPQISMIDTEKILALPMTSQITIVSHIDEVSDRDWVEKMHGAKANVTLRTLTQQGFGAQLPDFIGCEREGEEIIIGTLDEGNQDYVAVASNSENFVKIFGSQIISEYSRGRSKQLQK